MPAPATPLIHRLTTLFVRLFAETHLWIAAGAAFASAGTLATLGASTSGPLPLLVGAATGWVYTLQRFMKAARQRHAPDRPALRLPLLLLWTVAGIAALVHFAAESDLLSWEKLPALLAVSGFALVGALGYSLWPTRRAGGGLRDLPGLKLPLIATVWSLVTVVLPYAWTGQPLTASVPVALAQFAFILGITLPFDIRDMAFDAPSLKTVPQLLGPSRSTRLALFAVAFSAGFFYIADPSPERMIVSILALPIVAIGVAPRRPFYYLILIDGLILLQGWSVPVL